MANKNNTREGIHSGLSQSKSDEKWSDMLNFRSNDNRTFAVPRKLAMHRFDAGLHTVLHGVGDLNYAIGSKKSFVFRSHDGTEFLPLWHALLERETSTQDQSENLRVRGSYNGNVPRSIRVTVLDGQLVLDLDWPPTPEEVVETPFEPELNCSTTSVNAVALNMVVQMLPVYPAWVIQNYTYQIADLCLFGGTNYRCFELYTTSGIASDLPNGTGNHWDVVWGYDEGSYWYVDWYVSRNGVIYKCLIEHWASDLTSTPGVGSAWTSFWAYAQPLGSPIAFKPSKQYLSGDKVKIGSLIYSCNTTHYPTLLNQPGVGAQWTNVTTASITAATGAEVTIYQGTALIGTYTTNANGLLTVELMPNPYTITASYPDLNDKVTAFTKTTAVQSLTILVS